VAGTVDEGETYQVNIVKEIEEEIGLTNLTLAVGPKELVDDGRYRFFCQWFKAQVDLPIEAFVAQEEEIEAIKWMALRELKADVAKNPDKYTTYMNRWVEILTD